MADLSIKYKGAEIATLSSSGTKTLKTSGKYCEDDVTVEYTKPQFITVYSGTSEPSPSIGDNNDIYVIIEEIES